MQSFKKYWLKSDEDKPQKLTILTIAAKITFQFFTCIF